VLPIALPAALAGYVIGTLLALVLDRMYTGAPLRGPMRLCTHPRLPWCVWTGTAGYLLLRGRCPAGCRLPARLWYLPLVGAAAGAIIALRAAGPREAVLVAVFATVLLAFVGTDYERHLLPNRLMYPALALAVALCWAWPDRSAVSSLVGGMLGLAVMFALFVILPGFGFGDVKLAALMGLLVGAANLFAALAIGVFAAGLAILVMLISGRVGRHTPVAYGPYLALGAFLGMLMT
jgi:prepilin signal peptidase PulO-like enzyme (type II secretory pathway)